jgi:hypothetical protein
VKTCHQLIEGGHHDELIKDADSPDMVEGLSGLVGHACQGQNKTLTLAS